MDNFKITKTILENINEQDDKIEQCINVINGFTKEQELNQEMILNEEIRQQNELIRQEQYNNNKSRFANINQQFETVNEQLEHIIQKIDNHIQNHPSVGGGLTEQQVDDRIDIKLSTQYKANPISPIDIKTYDGSNQPTHPSVKFFENGFGGHKFWMAYTPFPNNNDTYENPCIAFSDDGVVWSEVGISNPIENTPKEDDAVVGYNSDTQLVFANGDLECWWRTHYRTGLNGGNEVIYRKKSNDGFTWGNKEELFRIADSSAGSLLSPVAIFDENKYKIWVCYKSNVLKYYESNYGTNWTYIRDISVTTNDGIYKVWHFDIIKNKQGVYEYVGCHRLNGQPDKGEFIYHATSKDNITYSTPIKILGRGYTGNFDDMELYRPSLCIDDVNNYRMYYGAQHYSKIWHIGLVTCRDIKSLNNLLTGQNAIVERLETIINEHQNSINDLYSKVSSGGGQNTPVEKITLNKNNLSLAINDTFQLVANVLPTNANNRNVTWESDNNTIAKVDNLGNVTGLNAGNCNITCKSVENNSITATCSIVVATETSDYVKEGLTHYFKSSEHGTVNTTFKDLSLNGNDATLVDFDFANNGWNGGELKFGTTSKVVIPDDQSVEDFTIEMYVKFNSLDIPYRIIGLEDKSAPNCRLAITTDNVIASTFNSWTVGKKQLIIGEYYHIVYIRNKTSTYERLIINNVEDFKAVVNLTDKSLTPQTYFFGDTECSLISYRKYNRVLTDEEISKNYNFEISN